MSILKIVFKNPILLLVALVLPLTACGIQGAAGSISPLAGLPLASLPLVDAPAGSTPTPTPFQPNAPTAVHLPTDFPTPQPTFSPIAPTAGSAGTSHPAAYKTWADYPGPVIWPDIDIPEPMGLLAEPDGQINILLLGSDLRPYDGGFRTDTILLVTINQTAGTVNVTSFPRDLYVYIPGWTVQRINTAHQRGDFETTAQTFEYNFGVRPDHYMLINFQSFVQVVDSLGGIDVEVADYYTDQRDGYGDYTVYPGLVHMDGEYALWYVRARYASSDFSRNRRQQEVLLALFQKLLSINAISRAPRLYDIYRQNVITDMTFNDMSPLLPLAAKLTDTSRIHRYYIGPEQVIPWTNTTGAQVLLPIREAVREVMRQALNTP